MQRESADRSDLGRIGEAVYGQKQDRQIQKQQNEQDHNAFPYLFHHRSAPPLEFSSSVPLVSSVNRQIIANRISAIMDPPFQLYAAK